MQTQIKALIKCKGLLERRCITLRKESSHTVRKCDVGSNIPFVCCFVNPITNDGAKCNKSSFTFFLGVFRLATNAHTWQQQPVVKVI